MTTTLLEKAEQKLKSVPGYRYNPMVLETKLAAGLIAGDVYQSGPNRLTFLGADQVRAEGRKPTSDGGWTEWTVRREGAMTEQQLEALLIEIACQQARQAVA